LNWRMVISSALRILLTEALMLLAPLLAAVYYGEAGEVPAFLFSFLVSLAPCGLLFVFRPKTTKVYSRESYAIVALGWILLCLFGALPYRLSGVCGSFTDSFFESVSAFTTTCATVLEGVEELPKSMQVWRGLSQWLGGMGVILFMLMAMPFGTQQSTLIARAEVAGLDNEKIAPKIKTAAFILYGMYVAFTALEAALLMAGGMDGFDAVFTAFGTISTGGYSVRDQSISSYRSAYVEAVVCAFLFVSGMDFASIYGALSKKRPRLLFTEQFFCYSMLALISAAALTAVLAPYYGSFPAALRYGPFQAVSMLTSTAYYNTPYSSWPLAARSILLLLMCMGACAGSTSGGLKMARILILAKQARRSLSSSLSANRFEKIRLNGRALEESIVSACGVYFILYIGIIAASALALAFDKLDFESALTSAVACLNNIGPGFGASGMDGNYSAFSALSKAVLSADMLFGRLEIFPALLLCFPDMWKKGY